MPKLKIVIPRYEHFRVGTARGMALENCRPHIEDLLRNGTLYQHAAAMPEKRTLQGRAPVYAVRLAEPCGNLVVRHSLRGGVLGRNKLDLFFVTTRGLRELLISLRLRAAGVATPEVVAYVNYRASAFLARGDVATREVRDSSDFFRVLQHVTEPDQRSACIDAVAVSVAGLTRAGAHHPDLNVKNILISWTDGEGPVAHVLDVDRVRFHHPGDPTITAANLSRLERSLRKQRDGAGLPVTQADLDGLRAAVLGATR